MTRKDYIRASEIIKKAPRHQKMAMYDAFVQFFSIYKNFDEEKFSEAVEGK